MACTCILGFFCNVSQGNTVCYSDLLTWWDMWGGRNKIRSTAQVYSAIYHVQEPIFAVHVQRQRVVSFTPLH